MTHPTDPAVAMREAAAQAAYAYIKGREIPGLAWRVRDLIQLLPIPTAQTDPRDEAEIRAKVLGEIHLALGLLKFSDPKDWEDTETVIVAMKETPR